MWRGHEYSLAMYGIAMCDAWIERGYRDTCRAQFLELISAHDLTMSPDLPTWMGDSRLHESHKSNLLRKDHAFYGRYGWGIPHDLPYYWPVSKE